MDIWPPAGQKEQLYGVFIVCSVVFVGGKYPFFKASCGHDDMRYPQNNHLPKKQGFTRSSKDCTGLGITEKDNKPRTSSEPEARAGAHHWWKIHFATEDNAIHNMKHHEVEEKPIVWDYIRPSSSFQNDGRYAQPSTPRVHSFPAVPRTDPAETNPPVGGLGSDIRKTRCNPYRVGFVSFDRRFNYLKKEGSGRMPSSPGPGTYEFRHVNGGVTVKRPNVASPCFCRPEGRLEFVRPGAWHQETPLTGAETRGTMRESVKAQPLLYSQSFRSKADRLVVNKPPNTTHEGIGPGSYDLTKDGKSVRVQVEKRVVRGGMDGSNVTTNPFLSDLRAYMSPRRSADERRPVVLGKGNSYKDGRNRYGCAWNRAKFEENSGPTGYAKNGSPGRHRVSAEIRYAWDGFCSSQRQRKEKEERIKRRGRCIGNDRDYREVEAVRGHDEHWYDERRVPKRPESARVHRPSSSTNRYFRWSSASAAACTLDS